MDKPESSPKYKVVFYQTPQGAEPVREWLQSMDKAKRLQLGQAIQVLQMNGPTLSMPYACPLGKGLYELRERSMSCGRELGEFDIESFMRSTIIV